MSTSSGYPYNDRWDSGQVGFIYATRDAVLKGYSVSRITKKTRAKVEAVLQLEVKTYDQFLQGDVWGYVIEDAAGKHVDSCWGYYGRDEARKAGEEELQLVETSVRQSKAAQTRKELYHANNESPS